MRTSGALGPRRLAASAAMLGLMAVGGAGTWGMAGCGPDPNAPAVTNAPTTTSPAPLESAGTFGPQGPTDVLTQQVQSYVAQFPADDKDRASAASKSAPQAGASKSTPQAAVSRSTTHPAVSVAAESAGAVTSASLAATPPGSREPDKQSVIYRSADAGHGAVATAPAGVAMTPMQLRPVEERAEAAGSPKATEASESPARPRTAKVELLGVHAAAAAKAPASQPALAGANQPTVSGEQGPSGIATLIAELEGSIKLHPQMVDDQFKLRLLYAATGHEDRAVGAIDGADPAQSALMAAVLKAVVSAKNSMQDPEKASAQAIAAADELRRLIAQQAPVMVSRVAMVTRVNSFGDYDAVNPPKFTAGQGVHVFLYTEVKNFKSESTPQSRLRTVLSEKVEIYDAAGKVIWQRSEPTIEDKSASPRTDFFMTMEIELPAQTPAGEYVLKVTVEDKLGGTTDQQRMGFSIDK